MKKEFKVIADLLFVFTKNAAANKLPAIKSEIPMYFKIFISCL